MHMYTYVWSTPAKLALVSLRCLYPLSLQEHECVHMSLIQPITNFVMEVLPPGQRDTTRGELAFEDLERLQLDDLANILEWLTEKVGGS